MAGRPSRYEERFCDEMEAFMAQGYSATAFAGHIGVSRSTIDNWAKEYPEFLEALNRAKAKRLLEWEKIGLKVAREGGTGGIDHDYLWLEKHGRLSSGSISNSLSTQAKTADQSKPSSYLR